MRVLQSFLHVCTYRAGSHRRESVEVRQGQHRRGIGPKSVDADEQHPLVRPAKDVAGIRAGDGVVGRRGGGTPQVVREVDERCQGRRGGVAGSGRGDGRHRLQGREEEKDEGGLHGETFDTDYFEKVGNRESSHPAICKNHCRQKSFIARHLSLGS